MPRDYTGKWVGGLPQCMASYLANEMEAIWSFLDNMISLLACFAIAMYNITVGLKARYKGPAAGDRISEMLSRSTNVQLVNSNRKNLLVLVLHCDCGTERNNATSISSSCITSSSGYVLSASRE